jgi:hypothetical protein
MVLRTRVAAKEEDVVTSTEAGVAAMAPAAGGMTTDLAGVNSAVVVAVAMAAAVTEVVATEAAVVVGVAHDAATSGLPSSPCCPSSRCTGTR